MIFMIKNNCFTAPWSVEIPFSLEIAVTSMNPHANTNLCLKLPSDACFIGCVVSCLHQLHYQWAAPQTAQATTVYGVDIFVSSFC